MHTATFNSKNFDIYESINFYSLICYFQIKVDKIRIMTKLFNKFNGKHDIDDMYNIFEAASTFTDSEKKMLYELVYTMRSNNFNKEELKFIDDKIFMVVCGDNIMWFNKRWFNRRFFKNIIIVSIK